MMPSGKSSMEQPFLSEDFKPKEVAYFPEKVVKRRGRKSKLSREVVYELFMKGLSASEIAYKFGVISSCVSYRLRQLEKLGLIRRKRNWPRGSSHPLWRGGKWKDGHGYIRIYAPEHHSADTRGYVPEHIIVWEQANNQLIPEGWIVHHINGIKDDNGKENLIGFPGNEHRTVIPCMAQRIKALEAENRKLRKDLSKS